MATLFEKRERAAESLFAHSEEVRFLVHRGAIEALGAWAGESMELDPAGRATYAAHLVDRLVAGATDDELLTAVQIDLERAGKPSLCEQARMVLAQAFADARQASSARPIAAAPSAQPDPHKEWAARHPKSGPSWSL